MVLYKEDIVEDMEWTIVHETGHLMNLDDQYDEKKDSSGARITPPKEGSGWRYS